MSAGGWSFRCQSCGAAAPFGPEVYGCPSCRADGRMGLLELHRAGTPDHDLVVVWRWHAGNQADFIRRVIAAIKS